MRDAEMGTYNGDPTYCTVNAYGDCPYCDKCGICHIEDPQEDCSDWQAFWESWEEWEHYGELSEDCLLLDLDDLFTL